MSLTDLAAIGSLVGSIAVVVSLIYLALQIRLAEKNQRAALNQGSIDRTTAMLVTFGHPEYARMFAKAYQHDSTFTAEEIATLILMLRASLVGLQDSLVQHRQGLIDQVTLDNTQVSMRQQLAFPVWRAVWLMTQHTYAPELRQLVDSLIAEAPVAPASDFTALFNAKVAELAKQLSAQSKAAV